MPTPAANAASLFTVSFSIIEFLILRNLLPSVLGRRHGAYQHPAALLENTDLEALAGHRCQLLSNRVRVIEALIIPKTARAIGADKNPSKVWWSVFRSAWCRWRSYTALSLDSSASCWMHGTE